ncbi:MAG: hypothetical protein SNJ58_01675 [Aggregatilineales bacterium]
MSISTLILIATGIVAVILVVRAVRIALQREQPPSTSLESLWPPRYFLSEPRRDVPPTVEFERPTPPAVTLPTSDQPTRLNISSELTSRIPREALQPPTSTDSPLDRTSQIQHPTPPVEPE